jgi:hypothetical protein
MTATSSIELPAWMAEQLSQASPDLLRQMVVGDGLLGGEGCCAGVDLGPSRVKTLRRYRQVTINTGHHTPSPPKATCPTTSAKHSPPPSGCALLTFWTLIAISVLCSSRHHLSMPLGP